MNYTYTLSELSALGVTDISISYRSLEADTASLRIPLRSTSAASIPWVYGDRVRILDERESGSPCIFDGRVKTTSASFSGVSYDTQVELANDVDVLEATTYAYIDDNGAVCYSQSFYNARAEGESPYGERLTSSRTVCERCFDWALAGGAMDSQRSVLFDSTILGVAGTGSQSCWGLIRQALKWVPDAVTWMDYTASPSCLNFGTARLDRQISINSGAHSIDAPDGTRCGTFTGIDSISLTPRPDLVPPVCAMTGRLQQVLPEGGDVRAPGAFVYHVRKTGSSTDTATAKKAGRAAALEMAPWQIVRGKAAPVTVTNAIGDVNQRDKATEAPAKILKWWSGEGGFALLNKLGTGCITFGKPLFEPVGASDAYEDDEKPANYETPGAWGTLYLLTDGSFPARASAGENVGGLKWCRGKLSQYVWITPKATLPESVSKDKVLSFFGGTYPTDGGTIRYALLTMDGVWINRRSTKYRQGDNKAGEAAAAVALADEDDASTPSAQATTYADYSTALQDFYDATRKLYYDGSITLNGVTGCPGKWLAHGVNVSGFLPEWATMASPCNAVDYDPITRRATLTLGSRENLTIDELLERQDLGRLQSSSRSNGDTDNPLDSTPDGSSSESDGGDDDEGDYGEMVAPSVNVSIATTATGTPLNPWEVYGKGNKYYINGGSVKTPDGWVTVEPMEIPSEHYKAGRRYFAKWSTKAKKVVYRYADAS